LAHIRIAIKDNSN